MSYIVIIIICFYYCYCIELIETDELRKNGFRSRLTRSGENPFSAFSSNHIVKNKKQKIKYITQTHAVVNSQYNNQARPVVLTK